LTIAIVPANQVVQKFAAKNFAGKFCLQPYNTIEVGPTGWVRLCGCANWMPAVIGNIFEHSLEFLLATPQAIEIRKSITQGTYDYCNENTCGVIANDQLVKKHHLSNSDLELVDNPEQFELPREIFLAGDLVCNLSCPSCRTSIVKHLPEEIATSQTLGKILTKNLFTTPSDKTISLHLSTTGELFASRLLLSFLENINIDDFPNLRLWIQTNGLLCKKFWYKIEKLESKIQNITVTIDAAEANTYHLLRRGGDWIDLQNNLAWLKQKKKQLSMSLHTRMIVQQQNYQQMKSFYDMSLNYDADRIEYSRINDWGTYPPGVFLTHDVFNPAHPEYQSAKQCQQQVVNLPRSWFYGGM
jgi:MoaA/NifB/PqqE/SkfB family radical SAM enzyme